jgi:hypothetical protein
MVSPIWNKLFLRWSSWALINRWIFSLLKFMYSNQHIDLIFGEAQELWSSNGWWINGINIFALIVQAWECGRGNRSWFRGESFQGWGDCWSGMHSCQTCDPCTWHLEQYCQKKVIWTCSVEDYDGTVTQGRCSTIMVCKQEYVILILYVLWFLCNSDPLLQSVQIKNFVKNSQNVSVWWRT